MDQRIVYIIFIILATVWFVYSGLILKDQRYLLLWYRWNYRYY